MKGGNMFFNRPKIPLIYKRSLVFDFLNDYLSDNNGDIKIIHNDCIIYPIYKKADTIFLHEIAITAKYSQAEIRNSPYSSFNQNLTNFCSLKIKSIDFLYNAVYKKLNYYSFYLPNDDIIYIKKVNNDYADYLKAKLLYCNILHLINPKRNAVFISVPF